MPASPSGTTVVLSALTAEYVTFCPPWKYATNVPLSEGGGGGGVDVELVMGIAELLKSGPPILRVMVSLIVAFVGLTVSVLKGTTGRGGLVGGQVSMNPADDTIQY